MYTYYQEKIKPIHIAYDRNWQISFALMNIINILRNSDWSLVIVNSSSKALRKHSLRYIFRKRSCTCLYIRMCKTIGKNVNLESEGKPIMSDQNIFFYHPWTYESRPTEPIF